MYSSRVVVAVGGGNELVVVSLWFEVAARHAKTKLGLKMSVNWHDGVLI